MNSRNILNRSLIISILLNTFLLGIVLCFFHPCFNNDPDIFYLYTLSGGYGNAPSALLHYSYGWHPILGAIISWLFSISQQINWYTLFLLAIHFISGIVLLDAFLKYFERFHAILAFLIFYIFIESRLLLGFNYSGAALIGTVAGSVALLFSFAGKKEGDRLFTKPILFFALLILLAGLIRIHYFAFFSVLIIWIGFFILSPKKRLQFFMVHVILGIVLLGLFEGQKYYYEAKIPGWKQEERLRKAYAYMANHSRTSDSVNEPQRKRVQREMVDLFFIPDSSLVNIVSVRQIGKESVKRFNSISENKEAFYWLFMDLRIYLFLFAAAIAMLMMTSNRQRLKTFLFMASLPLAAFIGICLFSKLTEVLTLAGLTAVIIGAIYCLSGITLRKYLVAAASVFGAFAFAWMIARTIKTDNRNRQAISYARSVIGELNRHPEILFVDAGSFFDLHLSICDLPSAYPLNNLLYNELFVANMYGPQLQKWNVHDLINAISHSENVCLLGEKSAIFIEYYQLFYNQNVIAIRLPGFQYLPAYRIVAQE